MMKSFAIISILSFCFFSLFAQYPFPIPIKVSNGTTSQGQVIFVEDYDNGQNTMTIQPAASLAGNIVYTFPGTTGSNGYVLSTNGSGVMSWIPAPSGGSTSYWDSSAGNLYPRDLTNNVGIGLNNPVYKLDLLGDFHLLDTVSDGFNSVYEMGIGSHASQFFLSCGNAVYTNGLGINPSITSINVQDTIAKKQTQLYVQPIGAAIQFNYNNATDFNSFQQGETGWSFTPNNGIPDVIDSSGNVGIGTPIPTTKLEVVGGFKSVFTHISGSTFSIDNSAGVNKLQAQSTGTEIAFISNQSTENRMELTDFFGGLSDFIQDVSGFLFSTKGDANAMKIDTFGNTGIGTALPQAKLHVVGDSTMYQSTNTNHSLVTKWDVDDSLFRIESPTGDTIAIGGSSLKVFGDDASITGDFIIGNTTFTDGGSGNGKLYKVTDNTASWVTGTPSMVGLGNVSNLTTASSTYTPTLTNTTNVTASTARITSYSQVGNIVTAYGTLDVTTTLAVATEVQLTLPVASDLATAQDLNGTAVASSAIATNAVLLADVTTNRARLLFIGLSVGGAGTIYFFFQYQVL